MANQDWQVLLNAMSVDNLRFEKEKRLYELSYLKDKLSRMMYREGSDNDEWEQSIDKASERKAMGRRFDAGGYKTENDLKTERATLESRVSRLKRELQDIEEALNAKTM